ncbi:NAD(P)-binding protein [Cadophora sp. DSE1049]|nr:NAD(P)-binding protein [Cadophora sp. DSE1049]
MSSSKTIVLISGANRGIGYETSLNLVQHSAKYHVLLGSRSLDAGKSAIATLLSSSNILGTVTPIQLDVTSAQSIEAAVQYIQETHGHLDILVNNAGIFPKNPNPRDAMNAAMQTNLIGAYALTESCIPLLKLSPSPSPRIVFVSSSIGSITHAADPNSPYHSPNAFEYRASKAAVNMLVVQYWVKFKGEEWIVHGVDPGLCVTDFMDRENQRRRGGVPASVGGERIACVVKGERDAEAGRVCGEYGRSPW